MPRALLLLACFASAFIFLCELVGGERGACCCPLFLVHCPHPPKVSSTDLTVPAGALLLRLSSYVVRPTCQLALRVAVRRQLPRGRIVVDAGHGRSCPPESAAKFLSSHHTPSPAPALSPSLRQSLPILHPPPPPFSPPSTFISLFRSESHFPLRETSLVIRW